MKNLNLGFLICLVVGCLIWISLSTSKEPELRMTISQLQQEIARIGLLQEQYRNAVNYLQGQRSALKDSTAFAKVVVQLLERQAVLNALEGQRMLITAWMNDSTKVKR